MSERADEVYGDNTLSRERLAERLSRENFMMFEYAMARADIPEDHPVYFSSLMAAVALQELERIGRRLEATEKRIEELSERTERYSERLDADMEAMERNILRVIGKTVVDRVNIAFDERRMTAAITRAVSEASADIAQEVLRHVADAQRTKKERDESETRRRGAPHERCDDDTKERERPALRSGAETGAKEGVQEERKEESGGGRNAADCATPSFSFGRLFGAKKKKE